MLDDGKWAVKPYSELNFQGKPRVDELMAWLWLPMLMGGVCVIGLLVNRWPWVIGVLLVAACPSVLQ